MPAQVALTSVARWMPPALVGVAVGVWAWWLFRGETGWEGVPLGLLAGVGSAAILYSLVVWLFGE
jgi:hypothetical protein